MKIEYYKAYVSFVGLVPRAKKIKKHKFFIGNMGLEESLNRIKDCALDVLERHVKENHGQYELTLNYTTNEDYTETESPFDKRSKTIILE